MAKRPVKIQKFSNIPIAVPRERYEDAIFPPAPEDESDVEIEIASWRERFTPSEQAIIAAAQRRVLLTHVGAGPDYMINKLAALLDEKEGNVS